MYQIIYYYKETIGKTVKEQIMEGTMFRLRRNALHYLLEIVQNDYRKEGYGTEPIVGGINCYKSEKTEEGNRKVIEEIIKVEKI